jgi:predicted DNA-binding protein (MmcQ/YjbR family)
LAPNAKLDSKVVQNIIILSENGGAVESVASSPLINKNLEFSRWNGIFYGEKLTTAIIDRLIHHSYLLCSPVQVTGL